MFIADRLSRLWRSKTVICSKFYLFFVDKCSACHKNARLFTTLNMALRGPLTAGACSTGVSTARSAVAAGPEMTFKGAGYGVIPFSARYQRAGLPASQHLAQPYGVSRSSADVGLTPSGQPVRSNRIVIRLPSGGFVVAMCFSGWRKTGSYWSGIMQCEGEESG